MLQWPTFWQKFSAAVDAHDDLPDSTKLSYLRTAVQDPEAELILNPSMDGPSTYKRLVKELHQRYERTKKIHRELVEKLINLPSAKNNSRDLRRLVDATTNCVECLSATGHFTLEAFITSMTYSKLPYKLQIDWDDAQPDDNKVVPYPKLLEYVTKKAFTLSDHKSSAPAPHSDPPEKKPARKQEKKSEHSNNKQRSHVYSVSTPSTSSNSYKWECCLCAPEKHPLHVCSKWTNLTVSQRLGHIQSKSLCSNCLAGGHTSSACKSTYRCRDCGQPHHTTIHQQQTANPVNSSSSQSSQVPDALMTTAQVLLLGPRGQEVKARALIDSGAGLSLISSRMANLLDLPLEPTRLQLSVAQGEQSKPLKHLTQLSISPIQNRSLKIPCRAAVTSTVTCDLPPQAVEQILDLPHIMGLQLADPDYHLPGRIDILLGADMAPKVMVKQLLRDGLPSQPIAQATHFGWVVSGPVARKDSHAQVLPASYHQTSVIQSEHDLISNIKQFWLSEEPEQEEPTLSAREQLVEGHFADTVKYLPAQARYEVTLPKLSVISTLGASKPQALSRFFSNERSVTRRHIWEPFQSVMREYFSLNHAEEVPEAELLTQPHFYMPMHAVMEGQQHLYKD